MGPQTLQHPGWGSQGSRGAGQARKPERALMSIWAPALQSLPTPGCFTGPARRGVLPGLGSHHGRGQGAGRVWSKMGWAWLGNSSKMELPCPRQPSSLTHPVKEGWWDARSLIPGAGPAAGHPLGLVYCSSERRPELIRNLRVDEFQGKGKNSTCLAGLGRRGPVLSIGGERGVQPLISGSTRLPLCTASKAPL